MGVAERFYEAFTVRDDYTMGLLYAEQATFSDPVFPLLSARGVRAMWTMLLSRADDLAIDARILEDGATRARAQWTARYTFAATGRHVTNRVHTEMALANGRIVRHVDRFSLWRWAGQALGPSGWALGWSPMLRDRIRAEAGRTLNDFVRKAAARESRQERR